MEIATWQPGSEEMVPVSGTDAAYKNWFQTLVLLAIDAEAGPVYFVIESSAEFAPLGTVNDENEYLYEEHSCPTNFIRLPMIATVGDTDPHGVFRHVRTIWMTREYLASKGRGTPNDHRTWLCKAFPEILNGEEE